MSNKKQTDENGKPLTYWGGLAKNKKQTAVDWLLEELVRMDKLLDGRRKNEDSTILKSNPTKIYEQAKAMEKEQMIDMYNEGYAWEFSAEEYYKKTYEQ